MDRTTSHDRATEIRCDAFAAALVKYRMAAARTTDPRVKAYYVKTAEIAAQLIAAIWKRDTVEAKILIAQFVRLVSENEWTQPPEFKALHACVLDNRRVMQDRKEGPVTGPKRRR